MKTKICYIISDVDESHQLEAMAKFISGMEYEVSVILINKAKPKLFEVFEKYGLPVKFIKYSGKKDIFFIFYQIYKILGEIKPDIVHTHLFYATFAGMMAAKARGIRRRIQSRHHSNGAHVYYPHTVKYEKFCNYLSSHISAITNTVADVLIKMEQVNPSKITVINYGFNFDEYITEDSAVEKIRQKYSLSSGKPIIGVISRYDHWKGIQYIIPAFHELLKEYPDAKLVLANARGNYENEVNQLLDSYLTKANHITIPFESDIYSLYKTFDILVHVPISPEFEAFGQVYVEALAMKIPSIFTLSGIANDFVENKKNAIVVPYCDSESIFKAMKILLENRDLCGQITEQGRLDVLERYSIEKMVKDLDILYAKL